MPHYRVTLTAATPEGGTLTETMVMRDHLDAHHAISIASMRFERERGVTDSTVTGCETVAALASEFSPRAYRTGGYWFAYVWHPNHGTLSKGSAVSHHPRTSKARAMAEARHWIATADSRPIALRSPVNESVRPVC